MSNKSTIKWIMERSKNQKGKLILLVLANAFFSMLSVAFAVAVKIIIDGATNVDREIGTKQLIWGGVGIGAIVLLQFTFRIIINGLAEHISAKLENQYREQTFSVILNRRYDKITGYHSGELINRLSSDVSVIADAVTEIVPSVVAAIVRLVCAIVVLVLLDPIFAVAFVVAGILVCVIITLVRGKLKSLHKEVQSTGGKLKSFLQECIENLLAVKVFSVNDKIEEQVENLSDKHFKAKMRKRNYSVTGNAGYNMIYSFGYIFALIYGAYMIFSGSIEYGTLSAILQLVNNVQVPFASLSQTFPKYYAMLASGERLMEIENIECEKQVDGFNASEVYGKLESINFDNVSFSYGRDKVLDQVNLSVKKGEFIAIMGGSGEGKSTLVKLLLGVYPVTDGEISLQLSDMNVVVDERSRKLFSYVPQQNMLISGSIKDNLTFINSNATEDQIQKALRICCCNEFIEALPQKLDTVIGEKGLGLSEGQIQRIAIARALLSNAPVILLDESTSALDLKTEEKLLTNLRELNDVTLLIVSHKKAALNICDRVIFVNKGKVSQGK